MPFAQILNNLLTERGLSNYQISKDTGISDSLIGYWRQGKRIPKADNLLQLANYLEVSTDYLLTGTEVPHSSQELSKSERECLDKFNRLLDIDKGRILDRMETLYESYSPEEKEDVS